MSYQPKSDPVRVYQPDGRPIADPQDPRRSDAHILVWTGALVMLSAFIPWGLALTAHYRQDDGGLPVFGAMLFVIGLVLWGGAYASMHSRKNDETDGQYGEAVKTLAKVSLTAIFAYRVGTAIAGKVYHDITD